MKNNPQHIFFLKDETPAHPPDIRYLLVSYQWPELQHELLQTFQSLKAGGTKPVLQPKQESLCTVLYELNFLAFC